MKSIRRVIGSIIIGSMIISPMCVAFAKNEKKVIVNEKKVIANEKKVKQDITKIPGYYEELSSYLGISIPDLKKLEEQYGELTEYLGLKIDANKIGKSNSGEVKASSGGGGGGPQMTDTEWQTFYNSATAGNIFVTKDSWTGFVNHGHAAICETHCDPKDGGKYIVQAEQPGTKSIRRNISIWRTVDTARIYYPTNVSVADRAAAGKYAKDYLQGIDYEPFADISSSKEVNCATLVWKAYNAKGFSLDTSLAFKYVPLGYPLTGGVWIPYSTCYPADIVEDTDTTLKTQIDWFGYPHTW